VKFNADKYKAMHTRKKLPFLIQIDDLMLTTATKEWNMRV